jgi:type IV fimbrial biogenesis protein FimT
MPRRTTPCFAPRSAARSGRQRGLTLIETCMACSIAATLLGTAIPSYRDLVERKTLEARATELAQDLQFARTQAVSLNQSLRISFQQRAEGSCYVIHTGAATACSCGPSGPAVCLAGAQAFKSAWLPAAGAVQVRTTAGAGSAVFDGTRGTVSPTFTARMEDRQGRAVHQVVNLMGRARACSPEGRLSSYKAC